MFGRFRRKKKPAEERVIELREEPPKGEERAPEGRPDRPPCVSHPAVPADGVCSRCRKAYCRGCLTYHEGSLLCLSCLEKASIMGIVMTIVSLLVVLAFFAVAYTYLLPLIESFIEQFFGA